MATLEEYAESAFKKVLFLGESKTGKTGALASLVEAGYKLFIIDFDAGLDYLAAEIRDKDPKLLKNIVYQTFRDKTKLTATRDVIVQGSAKAFDKAFKALDDGIDDTGPANALGDKWIVVIDSLWAAGQSAFFEHQKMQPSKDPRQNYGGAQQMILAMLRNLTDPDFETNVIVISHLTLVELETGITKGMPAAIGKAICPEIPKLFNRMLVAEVKGAGRTAKRIISTVPTALTIATSGDLKDKVPAELPLETGLATFFKLVGHK